MAARWSTWKKAPVEEHSGAEEAKNIVSIDHDDAQSGGGSRATQSAVLMSCDGGLGHRRLHAQSDDLRRPDQLPRGSRTRGYRDRS
mmetsp:Transcript_10693/g.37424  ORF Transcript_10693/g.37424 Transcript_10693/m.37424 type:complete len:86 (-) Transcript_10693:236-493(-)